MLGGKHADGILPPSNMSNPEFTYFLFLPWRGLCLTSYISHFTIGIVNVFYLHCLELESSSNIIFIARVPTHISEFACYSTSRAAFQIQLSFRCRGHLIKLLSGVQHVHNMQPLQRHCCFVPVWKMGKYLPCGQQLWKQRGDLCGKKSVICSSRTHTSLKSGLWPYKPLI